MGNLWKKMYRRGTWEVMERLRANRYYNWHVFSRLLSNYMRKMIEPHYTHEQKKGKTKNEVVVVHNGWAETGGLADRFRGIVSTYLLCKEMNREFRILFTSPFPLDMFLEPNTYDWRIREDEMTFDWGKATPLCLEVGNETRWQTLRQKAFLRKGIKKAKGKQVHIYTNALFAYFEGFGPAFQELFKPSERLQASIHRELQALGEKYVSVSARFMGTLGDFEDTMKGGLLPKDKQEMLLKACLREVEQIHTKHPNMKILVNSDSTTFLSRARQYPFVYTIPGHILHLDVTEGAQGEEQLYQTYEKTILDFFMIAHAAEVYRLQGKWLRSTSGFPLAASLIYDKPFHETQVSL